MNDLLVRAITGLIFVLTVIFGIYYSETSNAILFSFISIISIIEFNRLFSGHKSFEISWEWYSILATITLGIGVGIIFNFYPPAFVFILPPMWFLLFAMELFRKKAHPIANMSLFVFQISYLVLPFLMLIHLRNMFDAPYLIIGMFVLIWANDTFAYLSGRTFGKTKLFERISPKKTWEGTIGGAIMTVLFAAAYAYFFDPNHNYFFWILATLFIVPSAIIGDLLESLMKRSLNVKDSGNILPGHGGILDRFDAALFSIPFFYALCLFYTYFWSLT